MKLKLILKGGKGSGNHGHKGIPGHQGGSAPTGSAGSGWLPNDVTGGAGKSNMSLDRHAAIVPLGQGKFTLFPYSGSKGYMETHHGSMDEAKAAAEDFLAGKSTPTHWRNGEKASSGKAWHGVDVPDGWSEGKGGFAGRLQKKFTDKRGDTIEMDIHGGTGTGSNKQTFYLSVTRGKQTKTIEAMLTPNSLFQLGEELANGTRTFTSLKPL